DGAANLADDFKPALLLGFRFTPRRGRELQHRCNLTFGEEGEQQLFAIREFDRIVMTQWPVLVDLPKDCSAVPAYRVFPYIRETIKFHIVIESQLRSWEHTHHEGGIVLAGKPVRAHAEAFHGELVADCSWARLSMLQAVVAHGSCPGDWQGGA